MAGGAPEMGTFCRYYRDSSTRRSLDSSALRSLGNSPYKELPVRTMISPEVMQELLAVRQVLHYLPESQSTEKGWTLHEQQLFWVALTKYPQGPWTAIAGYIGTKTTRQAMTHAQKLRQKLKRWNSRLRSNPVVSSLMDGVTVSEDGNVTVSASSETPLNAAPYGIPLAASSFPTMAGGVVPISPFEGKDHGQHRVDFTPSSGTSPSGRVPYSGHPDQFPVPFLFDRRQHPNTPETKRTEEHAMQTAVPHDFVDEITKSFWEEDRDDDEVTEEELKEIDDGDLED